MERKIVYFICCIIYDTKIRNKIEKNWIYNTKYFGVKSCQKQNQSSTVFPFGGGSGAGVSVKPVAFLVVKEDGVRMLPVDQDTTYDRIVDSVPQVLDIIKSLVKDMCKKNKNPTNGNNSNDDNNSEENCSSDNF